MVCWQLLQSGAWDLERSLRRPLFFLYFREIRNKWSHWPCGQSAQRLYNSNLNNLCPCSRPAHVGKCWPWPEFKFSKTGAVGWLCYNLQLCQREIATDKIQEEEKCKEHTDLQNVLVSVHWLAQCHAKWLRHCREFQNSAGIKPT